MASVLEYAMSEDVHDIELVQSLARILREHGLSEIQYHKRIDEETSIRLIAPSPVSNQSSHAALVEAVEPVQEVTHVNDSQQQDGLPELANHPDAVIAPMVGTVYLQPEPNSPPFIEIGQEVAAGDTLFIIEAMKTMNHIPAPKAGTVRRILVENSSIVEYGSPLAIVD